MLFASTPALSEADSSNRFSESGPADGTPLFNSEIRPILAKYCLQCHGPDANSRQAELRLDIYADAIAKRGGMPAIEPGSPDGSGIIRRVTSTVDEDRMPPPEMGLKLNAQEVDSLKRWIETGAEYERHWAFLPVRRPSIPKVDNKSWPENEIDYFVLGRLEAQGLTPSKKAERRTLIRRVTLDLTGLPPTPAEVNSFLQDASLTAYEQVVDRLLASPRYGEHMAVSWLDLARYSDTHGYGVDTYRVMWQWRDWVINALNDNMPFDQFTIEQLSGDLLDEPTLDQLIATAFNRHHPIQMETGAIDEEYRVNNVVDRVNTTSTVWLGLSVVCAQCHDHKFDPVSQKEFYQLYAMFNQVPEKGVPSVYGDAQSALGNKDPQVTTPYASQVLPGQEKAASLTIMVMRDSPKVRETFVLDRGQYDRPVGAAVSAGIPVELGKLLTNRKPDRLVLARWLVGSENPLTARVTVNRYWQHFFGNGIVRTSEDFGSQGEIPTHPKLLDWLADEFRASGWDIKALHRMIVLSATYQQISGASGELRHRDPDNRWLARGPAVRLTAEMIRDQALFVSGLLEERVGGPPVRPYQPPGLWAEANYLSELEYHHDRGPGLYRRSLYTYWRRSVPPPAMEAFDAPGRDVCITRRSTTNTPQQSLVLLNDVTFVEAARNLAERVLHRDSESDRITSIFELVLARRPTDKEVKELNDFYDRRKAEFARDSTAAIQILRVGESSATPSIETAELAAWTLVARAVLNLNETITKR